jgi:nitroreductase
MEIYKAIKSRRSVRAYDSRPIPDEVCRRILDALRSAPSACNLQPWRFILVRDPDLRRQVAQACHGQTWMAQAPMIVVGCGLSEQAYKNMGGSGNSADIDVAIALDHLSLAAAGEGLGTCWIGAFDEKNLKKILLVPPEVKITVLMPVGYPKSLDLIFPLPQDRRKNADLIFCDNHFSTP